MRVKNKQKSALTVNAIEGNDKDVFLKKPLGLKESVPGF